MISSISTYLKNSQIKINLKACFYLSILKLLLHIFKNDECILFCRNIKNEAHIGNDKKASLSNSNNWFLGDYDSGLRVSSHCEAFPGLSGSERIMFKPCKDKRRPPQAMSWTVKHFHMTKSSPEVWPAGRAQVCRSEEARPSPACFSEPSLVSKLLKTTLKCFLWGKVLMKGEQTHNKVQNQALI